MEFGWKIEPMLRMVDFHILADCWNIFYWNIHIVYEYCTNINYNMNDAENFNSLSPLSPIKVPLNCICY